MKQFIAKFKLILVIVGLFFLPKTYADCIGSSSTTSFGSVNSFTVASTAQTVESGSGFTCTGSLLSLLGTNTVTATIASTNNASGSTPRLYNSTTGTYLPYSICSSSSCNSIYNVGSSITWSSTSLIGLLGLFNASDGSMPIFLHTSTGSNLPSGIYTDTITIDWNYSICFVGVLGICSYTTGTATSTVTVTLIVTDYCYIDSAPDVDFGTAALPSSFSRISSSLSVRCTLDAAYTVNLSSNNPEAGGWRQMSSSVDGAIYYLQYQLTRGSGTVWKSSNDYSNTGTGSSQSIPYTAIINSSQDMVPAGNYSDTITVTVTY